MAKLITHLLWLFESQTVKVRVKIFYFYFVSAYLFRNIRLLVIKPGSNRSLSHQRDRTQ
jgi:hypothetical protein